MVFLTSALWRVITYVKPAKGPDRYWKKRRIMRMAAHFYGRRQSCYTIALNGVRRALRSASMAGRLKRQDAYELNITRLAAACEQHGFSYDLFNNSLIRSNILLHKKILCALAIWEPRSFKCLAEFAWKAAEAHGLDGINKLGDPPSGVILKPMISK